LKIIGGNTDRLGGINASSYSPDAGGSGGNIRLDFDRIDLEASGQIAAATFGLGEAGDIHLDARELKVSGTLTQIAAQSQAEIGGPSGDLFIRAGKLTIENGGALSAATFGSGRGGNIELTAQDVLLNGGARNVPTGITVEASGSGEGGSVFLKTDRLRIYNSARIASSTSGSAAGGGLTLETNSLLIDGGGTGKTTGLFATSDTATSGSAGMIAVRSSDITLIRGGSIAASTYGSGAGGDIRVDAEHLTITGDDTPRVTGIGADSRASRFGGPGGNVLVQADEMLLQHRGTISAVTFGDGDGGDVQVNAKTLRIDGDGADGLTGINASSSVAGSRGAGGTIRLRADTVSLIDGGQVSALTAGLGRGGDVYVTAEELRATGARSGINAPSIGTGRSGNGGLIVIDAGRVKLSGGASVEASTSGSGRGGDIVLQSDNLVIQDGAVVAARAGGAGAAGSVRLDIGGPVLIAGDALVTSSSRRSTAGSVVIESDSDIRIRESEISVEALGGDAGSIALNASRLLFLDHADVIAAAGLNGGNISMDSRFLVVSDSLISANAAAGRGGNITLVADNFFQSGTTITATGAQAGTINIVTPELDLSTGLVELPSSLFDASTQFREQCARRLGSDFSSFLVLGRGGVADSPDEPQVVISRKRRAARGGAAR
jgi:large exoprotein involved in heme utilization and adhesion